MVASGPSATLKFDTDFDFDLSNAQFKKEELATELHHGVGVKGWWDAFTLFYDDSFLMFGSDVQIKSQMSNLNLPLTALTDNLCLQEVMTRA